MMIASWHVTKNDITSGSVHIDVCWLDHFAGKHNPLGRWTLPLVMSLRHNGNFSAGRCFETASPG